MDSEHGSGSSKHPSVTEEEAMVHFDESFGRSNSGKYEHYEEVRVNLENTTSEVTHSHTENSRSSNSVPSSSSEFSLSDDFFQVDPIIIPSSKPTDHNVPPKSEENTTLQVEVRNDDVYSGPLYELEEIFRSSPSISQLSVVTHESVFPTLSPTKSPPIQVMEKMIGYDPDRIPASVFTRPSTPMDWSVASNESLFSIQIGNCSFSRDHLGKLGGDTYTHKEIGTSRELDYSSEWYRSGELKSSSDLIRLRQPSLVTKGGDHKLQDLDLWKAQVFEKPKQNVHNKTIRDQGGINPDEGYSHTDENKTNGLSCAFPIKKFSQPSCLCTDCSCAICSCKLPCYSSCCSKRPCCSCKYLSLPRCSCKSLCMPSCCRKWPSCSCSCRCCSSCPYICSGCSSCCCKCSSR